MRLHHEGGDTGHVRGSHGGTGEGNTLATRTYRGRYDLGAGGRQVGLNEAVGAVLAAGARGVQIERAGVTGTARSLEVGAQLHGHRAGGQSLLQVLTRGGREANTGDGRVTANADGVALIVAGHDHAQATGGLHVIEAGLRTARERQVVLIPVDVHPLTLQGLRLISGEGLAGVAVALGGGHNLAAQLLGGCRRVVEVHRVVTLQPRGAAARRDAGAIHGLGGAVGVSHRQRRCGVRGATGVGVGVAHAVVIVGVTRRRHGEHTLAGHRVNHVRLGVVGGGELAAQREVHNVGAVGEVAVTVGVHHGVQGLHDHLGVAVAAEHTHGQKLRLRGGAGANRQALELVLGQLRVVAAEGRAALGDTVSGRGAGNVGAVTAGTEAVRAAVQRVVVRLRGGLGRVGGVVVVTHEVHAADELGAVNQTRIGGGQLRHGLGLQIGVHGSGAAKVGVSVVHTLRVDLAAGVHALLRDNRRDALHVGAVCEGTNLGRITHDGRAAHGVVGGVHELRSRSRRYRLSLRLHLGGDGLHLRLTVDGRLLTGQDGGGLGLLEGALALELHVDGNGSLGLLQARAQARGRVGCAGGVSTLDLRGGLGVRGGEARGHAQGEGEGRTQACGAECLEATGHSAAWTGGCHESSLG